MGMALRGFTTCYSNLLWWQRQSHQIISGQITWKGMLQDSAYCQTCNVLANILCMWQSLSPCNHSCSCVIVCGAMDVALAG